MATAYMGGNTIFAHYQNLGDTLNMAAAALAVIGLTLNVSKAECWIN